VEGQGIPDRLVKFFLLSLFAGQFLLLLSKLKSPVWPDGSPLTGDRSLMEVQ
jgi:hypothetical protein